VRPEAFRVRVEGDGDAHAPTLPDLQHNTPTSPPGPRPGVVVPPKRFELGPTGWRILWIVAALASICAGVWLSLHAP
jgi:hypothetical protein